MIYIFRFDLIFLMLDPQNEIFDRRLARHLISLYYTKKTDETEEDDADISIVSIIILITVIFF